MDKYLNVDLFGIIGVSPECTPSELREAYYAAALETHPDKNHKPNATGAFQELRDAYDILRDPQTRLNYHSINRNFLNRIYKSGEAKPQEHHPERKTRRQRKEDQRKEHAPEEVVDIKDDRTRRERKRDHRNGLSSADRQHMNDGDWQYFPDTFGHLYPENVFPGFGEPKDYEAVGNNTRDRDKAKVLKRLRCEEINQAKRESTEKNRMRTKERKRLDEEAFLAGKKLRQTLKHRETLAEDTHGSNETRTVHTRSSSTQVARERLIARKAQRTKPLKPKLKANSSIDLTDYDVITQEDMFRDEVYESEGDHHDGLDDETNIPPPRMESLFDFVQVKRSYHVNVSRTPDHSVKHPSAVEKAPRPDSSECLDAGKTWTKKNFADYDMNDPGTFHQDMKLLEEAEEREYKADVAYIKSMEDFVAENEALATDLENFREISVFQHEASMRFDRKQHQVLPDEYKDRAKRMASLRERTASTVGNGRGGQIFQNTQIQDEATRTYYELGLHEKFPKLAHKLPRVSLDVSLGMNKPAKLENDGSGEADANDTDDKEPNKSNKLEVASSLMLQTYEEDMNGNVNVRPVEDSIPITQTVQEYEKRCAKISQVLDIAAPKRISPCRHALSSSRVLNALPTFYKRLRTQIAKCYYPRELGGKVALRADKIEVRASAFSDRMERRAEKLWLGRNLREEDEFVNKSNRQNLDFGGLSLPVLTGQPSKKIEQRWHGKPRRPGGNGLAENEYEDVVIGYGKFSENARMVRE